MRLLVALAVTTLASAVSAVEPASAAPDPEPAADLGSPPEDDATFLETPAFPSELIRRGLRLSAESGFLPDADVGSGHVTLYQPALRGRLTVPVSKRAVLRFAARAGLGRYEFRGADPLTFGGRSLTGDSLHLYRTRLDVQGTYRLNQEGASLLRDGEVWALLGGVQGGADFESGAFSDGIFGGAGVALGYELDDTVRLVLGVAVSSSVEDGGVEVDPIGAFRWNLTEAITLHNRGLGLQVDYAFSPDLELFVAGFRESETYNLDDISGVPDELTLRDRRWQSGIGLEWKASRKLRVISEVGAVVTRKLRVHSDDFGTLDSARADGSVYFELRFDMKL